MDGEGKNTEFAPAERASAEAVLEQSRLLAAVPLLGKLYDAVNEAVLIVNRQRQIVFCNGHLVGLLGVERAEEIYGLRPGEALACVHACRSEGGCGTTQHCSACGAVTAVLSSMAGQQNAQECHILRQGRCEALDLLVRATPMAVRDESFTILAVTDIGHEKRRRALERVFFHDVMNTVAGLQMLVDGLPKARPERSASLMEAISGGLNRLVNEIMGQRDLMAAECDDLSVDPVETSSRELLESIMAIYRREAAAEGCRVALAEGAADAAFRTDVRMVTRVLDNMVRNAVEASGPGQKVTIGCDCDGGEVRFSVHNEGCIPRPQQLQLFQRSFSTKGPGRGLGTYSMKLLTEKYLKGRIEFSSTERDGTRFVACYPVTI